MTRWTLVVSLLFVFCFQAVAELPTETSKPYHLQIMLRFAQHRLLTDVFQDKVQRELRDSLQAALGDLAKVEVVRDHPRLREVETKGLKHALDGWNFISDAKMHFVLIDFVGVSQVGDQGGAGQNAFRVPWTILQVVDDARDGKCLCLLFHRYDNPLADAAGVLGYRCLKLGTITAPLRLRVVSDDRLGTPLNGRRVQISARDFQETALEQRSTNSDGLVTSVQPYQNVAFVRVFDAATPLAKIPVEIIDDRMILLP